MRHILTIVLAACCAHAAPAPGPLRVHPGNPRYFTSGEKLPEGSLKAVYLTGAHTWNNLVDMGQSKEPERFDFPAYLGFLERHHHNFIRLWAWDSTLWNTRANGSLGKAFVHYVAPLPWARTGPELALDGKPKFDLTQFDPAYFERLHARVSDAGKRGIYVSVMLFEGWGLFHGNRGRQSGDGWAWRAHPFNPSNNINGIRPKQSDAVSARVHTRSDPVVNDIQAAYIRKVIDTLNDLDNVLYEVINEGGEKEWDWWVVQTIRDHQRAKPKQHLIGITGHGAEKLGEMLASPADWISPGRVDGYAEDPPAWNQPKVSILDTDHIWGVGGDLVWVWKSFLRGHNPIFMDPYDGSVLGKSADYNYWEPIRRALGHTRRWAERVNLVAMTPQPKLSTTGYCLANAGKEYLVYQPEPGAAFKLQTEAGVYEYEWTIADYNQGSSTGRIHCAGLQEFKPPFQQGAALLYLRAADIFSLRLRVSDAETDNLLPCRVYVQGADGSWHFTKSAGGPVEYRKQKDWNPASVEMHTTHAACPITASLAPGKYTVLIERGKEYFPESREVNIENDDVRLEMKLRRWINMAELGWYSGDTHVHRPLSELPNLLMAEDLNVAFPLTSWVTDAFVSPIKGRTNADQRAPAELVKVDRTHVIYPRNTEYEIFRVGPKSHTLGAFFVLGHKTLFDTGVPPVRPIAEKAHREGALLELDKHNWEWSMMLVPIMGVDLYELSNNHIWRTEFGYRDYGVAAADYMQVERSAKDWTERGWIDYGFQNYYALLNCGFRLRPTAGTASGVHPVPLGFGRVYVRLKEPFSYEAWVRGLNEGNSFVTTGPMLFAELKGAHLTGTTRSGVPLQSIEVIVNGEVARKLTPGNREIPGKGYESAIDTKLDIDSSSWIAVRCFEDRPDKRVRFAHTAPFHIDVPGKPLRPRRVEIDYLIKRIETELSRNADFLPAPALDEYREALRIYQDIARNAR